MAAGAMGCSGAFSSGLAAYKCGRYDLAAEQFRFILNKEPSNWQAQFYFAMALAQSMQTKNAEAQFRSIAELCPDTSLRRRAELAAGALRSFRQ